MPNRVAWEAEFEVGHELIDAQHRGLLGQCDRLADLCLAQADEENQRQFDLALDRLKTLAREHFDAEAALLATGSDPEHDLEDLRIEREEFEYLAGEIATTGNFDRLEVQRFLSLWCLGHIKGSAPWQRAGLAGGSAPT